MITSAGDVLVCLVRSRAPLFWFIKFLPRLMTPDIIPPTSPLPLSTVRRLLRDHHLPEVAHPGAEQPLARFREEVGLLDRTFCRVDVRQVERGPRVTPDVSHCTLSPRVTTHESKMAVRRHPGGRDLTMMLCLDVSVARVCGDVPTLRSARCSTRLPSVHFPLTFIIDNVAGLLKVHRIDDLVVPVILVAVQILGLSSVAGAVLSAALAHPRRRLTSGRTTSRSAALPAPATASPG